MAERLVVDASAMVDLLLGSPVASSVHERLRGHELHAPAHFDAEILSALARLTRSGDISARQAAVRLGRLEGAPVVRHLLPELLEGAWKRRQNLRLVDALYVELADHLDTVVVTTDAGLAAASPRTELSEGGSP